MERHRSLILSMMNYEKGCPQRIQHFLKVLSFSELIAQMEGLDGNTQEVLKSAAVVHDIGIRPSLKRYGSSAGQYQQLEGPPLARSLLEILGYDEKVIERVCYLVGHHHSYDEIDGEDYQILVEADFLVNIYEGDMKVDAIRAVRDNIFRTDSGKFIFDRLYPVNDQ
ncbi:MAG: HD domain-containing protein [Tissierellia bacterium]|nr:HD domain-containing protein [Tissierellia bacterium]